MLPNSKRINLKTEFKNIVKGKRWETSSFKFFFIFQPSGEPRVGVSLSKQYFKKAVLRNKGRRIASLIIEENYNSLKDGLNLIIMPKDGVLSKDKESLIEEVKSVKGIFNFD